MWWVHRKEDQRKIKITLLGHIGMEVSPPKQDLEQESYKVSQSVIAKGSTT